MRKVLVKDRISQLPDELLLRILSFLPTKKNVTTMVLSKRWQNLWMMVPKLVYDDSYENFDYRTFTHFVNSSLHLHEAQAIESLHIKLGKRSRVGDIQVWIRAAVKRRLRELIIEIDFSSSEDPVVFPLSLLYTGCRMLVTLKLNNAELEDDSSSISFPSLKSLSLLSVEYPDDNFVERLLSNCPVLEDLAVEQCLDDNMTNITVKVPSLKSLVLRTSEDRIPFAGYVIDAPSLKYLDIRYFGTGDIQNNMPNIVKAIVDSYDYTTRKILRSITAVKRLHLCLSSSKNAYCAGTVFYNLVHLTLCTCEGRWLDLLMRLLRDSPNLQALKFEQHHTHWDNELRPRWMEPSFVPECLKKRIETLEWLGYEGAKEEKEVTTFILRSGRCLKKVTIIPHRSIVSKKKKLEMIKELALLPRRSRSCQLIFD